MNDVRTLGIVGSGQMGGGIGQVAAQAGFSVVLYDVTQPIVTPQATPETIPSPTMSPTPGVDEPIQEPREPVFPTVEQRPLPPLPNLTRLGVTSDNTLTLTLNDAIKRALENSTNTDRLSKKLRTADMQLRKLHVEFTDMRQCGSGAVPFPNLEDPNTIFDTQLLKPQIALPCNPFPLPAQSTTRATVSGPMPTPLHNSAHKATSDSYQSHIFSKPQNYLAPELMIQAPPEDHQATSC